MKQLGITLTVLTIIAAAAAIAPIYESDSRSEVIEGEYIVVFKKEITTEEVGLHKKVVSTLLSNNSKIIHHYEIGNEFRGYSAKMSPKELTKVRTFPGVEYIERNQVVRLSDDAASVCTYQRQAPWGLVRTTVTQWPPTSYEYHYKSDGEGVNVYVIDSGIETSHPDFQYRAKWGVDLVRTYNARYMTDENGHGTHVTGTIIGQGFGMAKKATAIAVRVFDGTGKGDMGTVLKGINWVSDHHNPNKPTVVNMSLGGGAMYTMDQVVLAAISKGIHFAVAAGNEAVDACTGSPSRVSQAVTVGASDMYDDLASFSNYGQCVDIIAPGVDITSTWIGTSYNTISGTSMATPHVAGVMAKILSGSSNFTPAQLKEHLESFAIRGKINGITGSKWQTPNLLLYHPCSA